MCNAPKCYYCHGWLSSRHEHDHFPIPKRHKGTEVVAACLNCHDLKDRTPIDQWNAVAVGEAFQIFSVLRERGIQISISEWEIESPPTYFEQVMKEWSDLSAIQRILWAKMMFIAFDKIAEERGGELWVTP